MKIDIRKNNVVYIEIDKHTYYIDNSTNEQIVDKWKTKKESKNVKIIESNIIAGIA